MGAADCIRRKLTADEIRETPKKPPRNFKATFSLNTDCPVLNTFLRILTLVEQQNLIYKNFGHVLFFSIFIIPRAVGNFSLDGNF